MKSLSFKLGVILIGLLILGNAEICGAGGAWVLWKESRSPKGSDWKIESAYPTYNECKQHRDSWVNLAPGSKKYDEIIGNKGVEIGEYSEMKPDIIYIDKDGKYLKFKNKDGYLTIVLGPNEIVNGKDGEGYLIFRYQCLPDTVDPRK